MLNYIINNMQISKIKIGSTNIKKYNIDNNFFYFGEKKFDLRKNSYSNLIIFLKKHDIDFYTDVIKNVINEKCIICNNKIDKYKIDRGKIIVDSICKQCRIEYNVNSRQFIKKNKCKMCSNIFLNIEKSGQFCSDVCLSKNRSIVCKNGMAKHNTENHWTKNQNEDNIKKIYKEIGKKEKLTKSKLNIVPWNKGKELSKIYCDNNRRAQLKYWNKLSIKERIKKKNFYRNLALKNMEQYKHQTRIEKKIEKYLIELLNINKIKKYKYSFIFNKRQYDFLINDNIIIEVHGDYWHGNTNIKKFKNLTDKQKMKKIDDKIKKINVETNGYKYFYFWETDINNNFNFIKNKILEIIS